MSIKVVTLVCCLHCFAAADLAVLRGLSTRWDRALQSTGLISSMYGNKANKLASAMGSIPRGGATLSKAAKGGTSTLSKKATKSALSGAPQDEYTGKIAMGGSGMKSSTPFASASFAPIQPSARVTTMPSTFAPQGCPPPTSLVQIPTDVPVSPTKNPASDMSCYNSCASPLAISVGTTFFAGTSCARPTATFYDWFGGVRFDLPGSWFTFLAPENCGTATVSVTETGDSDVGPLFFVYDGANGTCVSAAEESAFVLAASDPKSVTWATTVGTTYTIFMAFNGTGPFSTFNVDVTCAPLSARPCSQSCTSPIELSVGTKMVLDSSCMIYSSMLIDCADDYISSIPGGWFTFQAPKGCGTAQVFAKLGGNAHLDYAWRFYNGTKDACSSATNASGCLSTIYVNQRDGGLGWAATDGATYTIFLELYPKYSKYPSFLTYEVNVTCTTRSNLPCPSSCSSPLAISTGITEVDSSCLTNNLSPHADCSFGDGGGYISVTWFTFQAPPGCGTATVAMALTGTSAFSPHVNVYEGTVDGACNAALNVSACVIQSIFDSEWTWSPTVGTTYVIVAVGTQQPHPSGMGYNGEAISFDFSTFTMEVTCK